MPYRWGIVSAGKISNDFVNSVNTYPDKGDQVIAAVAARDKNRAAQFAKVHKIPKVFDTYQAMAVSDDIDIAYIGALNPDHYALTKLFLENGKHVLCEKPLCLNYKQSQSLVKIAREKNLFLMEAVWSRFSPSYIALEKDINDGKLGDIQFVEVTFGFPNNSLDRLSKKDLGGSALLDLGIYVLQFSQFVFKDEPLKITSVGSQLNESGVDVMETIIIDYSGNRRAVLTVNGYTKLWNKATVYGTKGRATLDEPFHLPTKLIRVDGKVDTFPLHTSPHPYDYQNSAGLVYQTLETIKCLKEGKIECSRMPHSESLLLAKMLDTVRQQIGVHYDADDQEYP